MTEERATYRLKFTDEEFAQLKDDLIARYSDPMRQPAFLSVLPSVDPLAPPSMAMTLNELSGVILDVERAFPDAGYEIAKVVYHVDGERVVEFWAEITPVDDRPFVSAFDAYGDSPAAALRQALGLARKAANP